MVRHAFAELSDYPTKLIAFSDDMDGMRKVAENLPNRDMLAEHLDEPLCRVPNPFDTEHESFAAHNNAILREFLDRFGFDYEFMASSDCYSSGRFDETLRLVLARYGKIMDVRVVDPATDEAIEHCIFGGQAKLQWKVDWALRWTALGVDYEMAGKDLIDSVTQSSKITRVLGAKPPEGFNYELFLDENGQKISKTKGNGVTIDEWLTYAPEESLSFYIYRDPKKAKQLSFGIIPKAVDEYQRFLDAYPAQEIKERLGNPVHHVHGGNPPQTDMPISFALLLNLVSVAHTDDKDLLWAFVQRYAPEATPESHPGLDALIGHALAYFRDFVADTLERRAPDEREAAALRDLDEALAAMPEDADGDTIQNAVFEVGKRHEFDPLRDWFKALYETLLGSSQGPRMGSFTALYGIENVRKLIAEARAA
jgi:lysyl-tRNA synthetase class 1